MLDLTLALLNSKIPQLCENILAPDIIDSG